MRRQREARKARIAAGDDADAEPDSEGTPGSSGQSHLIPNAGSRGLSTLGLTPGTPLMLELQQSLEFYICQRLLRFPGETFELSSASVQVRLVCFDMSKCLLAAAQLPGVTIELSATNVQVRLAWSDVLNDL